MTTQELLDYCATHAVRLWVADGKLRYDYPKGAITGRILNSLKEHKADVIALLSKPSEPPAVPAESLFAVCSSSKENPANCKQESSASGEPVAWEGDIPIYLYPGEKCIRCNQRLAVGTLECPRWCSACHERDQAFMQAFYADKPRPTRVPLSYTRPLPNQANIVLMVGDMDCF